MALRSHFLPARRAPGDRPTSASGLRPRPSLSECRASAVGVGPWRLAPKRDSALSCRTAGTRSAGASHSTTTTPAASDSRPLSGIIYEGGASAPPRAGGCRLAPASARTSKNTHSHQPLTGLSLSIPHTLPLALSPIGVIAILPLSGVTHFSLGKENAQLDVHTGSDGLVPLPLPRPLHRRLLAHHPSYQSPFPAILRVFPDRHRRVPFVIAFALCLSKRIHCDRDSHNRAFCAHCR